MLSFWRPWDIEGIVQKSRLYLSVSFERALHESPSKSETGNDNGPIYKLYVLVSWAFLASRKF